MEELEEKKKELKEAMQQLKAEGSISAKSESNPIFLNFASSLFKERPFHTYTVVCYSSGCTSVTN